MDDLSAVLQALQGGGNVALCVSVFAIWKASERLAAVIEQASERLARIEKALDAYMRKDNHGMD